MGTLRALRGDTDILRALGRDTKGVRGGLPWPQAGPCPQGCPQECPQGQGSFGGHQGGAGGMCGVYWIRREEGLARHTRVACVTARVGTLACADRPRHAHGCVACAQACVRRVNTAAWRVRRRVRGVRPVPGRVSAVPYHHHHHHRNPPLPRRQRGSPL